MSTPSKKRATSKESLKQKAARGDFRMVDPLDYLILGYLPQEGELFAGLYPLGERSINLAKKFDVAEVTSTFVSTRLRIMNIQGLTVKIDQFTSHGGVWQRTSRGTEVLNKWKANNGRDSG